MRWIVTPLALLVLAVAGGGVAHAQNDAQTQATLDAVSAEVLSDLRALGINAPVYMAQHLPAVMPAAGIGAGSGLSDDSGGVSIGVVTRIGLMNNFKDVGYGMKLLDVRGALPNLMPWPQFGVVAGFGLGDGLELGADIQFIPEMDIAGDNISLSASLISVAATFRWRINKADGIVPAVVLGLGGSYYRGSFKIGAGYRSAYSDVVDGHLATGTAIFEASPGVEWELFQFSPELRLAWDIGGVVRPYIGIGLGLTGGTVSDTISLKAAVRLDEVDGRKVDATTTVADELVSFETEPALYVLRPHVGIDFVFGIVAITAQVDFAIMGKDEINADFDDATAGFDTSDPGFLFNDNASGSTSNAAVVATVAVRLQF